MSNKLLETIEQQLLDFSGATFSSPEDSREFLKQAMIESAKTIIFDKATFIATSMDGLHAISKIINLQLSQIKEAEEALFSQSNK